VQFPQSLIIETAFGHVLAMNINWHDIEKPIQYGFSWHGGFSAEGSYTVESANAEFDGLGTRAESWAQETAAKLPQMTE